MATGNVQLSSIQSLTNEMKERRSSIATPADAQAERAAKRAKEAEIRGEDSKGSLDAFLARIAEEETPGFSVRV